MSNGEMYRVMNIAPMMRSLNLVGTTEKGWPKSLILAAREVSQPLSEEEFRSPELQKMLGTRDLVDVTKTYGAKEAARARSMPFVVPDQG